MRSKYEFNALYQQAIEVEARHKLEFWSQEAWLSRKLVYMTLTKVKRDHCDQRGGS